MGRAVCAILVASLLLGGCGGGDGSSTSAAACDDGAFRGQDEELYVTRTAVSNAIGGGGAAATLLLDLQRARRVLVRHLDAHPPCDRALQDVEKTEREAIVSLDQAVSALERGDDAGSALRSALQGLTAAGAILS